MSEIDKSKYKLYIETIQTSSIKSLIEALKEILHETNIHFDSNSVRILSMDNKKVAFVQLKLDASQFQTYHCSTKHTIGVPLQHLLKLVKTVSNSDVITLFITNDDEEKLGVKIENKEKKIMTLSKLKLIDIDSDKFSIPNTTYDHNFTMQCVDFQKHCRELKHVSKFIDIYTKHNGDVFIMSADGDNIHQEVYIAEPKPENSGNDDKVFIGRFDIEYLNLFCKSSNMCPTVQILLKENHPMILIYSVANLGHFKLGLAPKAPGVQ
jgi:proliferating cell nuclear antigen